MNNTVSRAELEAAMFKSANVERQALTDTLRGLNGLGLYKDYKSRNKSNPFSGYCLIVSLAVRDFYFNDGSLAYRIEANDVGADDHGIPEPQYHVFIRRRNDIKAPVDLTAPQFTDAQFLRVQKLYSSSKLKVCTYKPVGPRGAEIRDAVRKLAALMGWTKNAR